MKKKFIGPPNPVGPDGEDAGHDVRVGGRSFGIIRSGEVLEIPAEEWGALVADHEAAGCPLPTWSADLWEDVADVPAKKKSGDH